VALIRQSVSGDYPRTVHSPEQNVRTAAGMARSGRYDLKRVSGPHGRAPRFDAGEHKHERLSARSSKYKRLEPRLRGCHFPCFASELQEYLTFVILRAVQGFSS
jgi:hypothetical protein